MKTKTTAKSTKPAAPTKPAPSPNGKGTSPAPALVLAELKTAEGQTLGTQTLNAKTFSTGSRGFHTQGKVEIAGKRYQMNLMLVEIGSKES